MSKKSDPVIEEAPGLGDTEALFPPTSDAVPMAANVSMIVNIQTPYDIFIYVEGGISDHHLKAGWAERISGRLY